MKLMLDCKHGFSEETLFKVVKENDFESYLPGTCDEFLTGLIVEQKLDYDKAVDLSVRSLNTRFASIIRRELVSLFGIDNIEVNVSNGLTIYKIDVDISYEQPDPRFVAGVAYKILRTTMPAKLEPVLGPMIKTYGQMIAENVKYYKCSYKEAKQLVDIIMLDRVVTSIVEGCLYHILSKVPGVVNSCLQVCVGFSDLEEVTKLRRKYGSLLQKLVKNVK